MVGNVGERVSATEMGQIGGGDVDGSTGDSGEVESGDSLGARSSRKDLLGGGTGDPGDHSLRVGSGLSQLPQRQGIVPFRQASAPLVED